MIAMRAQAIDTVADLFEHDPRVAVVLAEISVDRFAPVFAHDPSRAVNVGIMEQTMVGVAAGYALEGFHPVIHTITPFVAERALEQLKLDFGHQQLGVLVITVGGSYDYGSEGPTHHSPGDVQALLTIPATEILVPGAAAEADRLVRATYANGHVTYLRTQTVANDEARDVEFGRLLVERRGSEATVIAVGPMLDRTLEATAGMDVTVLYATTLSPFDAETLNRELAGEDVIVVEPFYAGTLAGMVSEALRRPSRPPARRRRAARDDPRLRHPGAARPRAGPGRRRHPPAGRVCDRLIQGIPAEQSPFQYRLAPMPNLLIIIASTRPGRAGLPVARWFEPIARAHGAFDVAVADLAEWNLPFLDEPDHPKLRRYTKEHTVRWSAEVDAADAFVFVMPEYNHGFNAPLKNAIDFLHQEWAHKPAGFVSYGGVAAGMRAVQQLKQVLISLNMVPVNDAVAIQFIAKQIEDGELVAGEILEQAADAMLTELARVAEAARSLREATQPAS